MEPNFSIFCRFANKLYHSHATYGLSQSDLKQNTNKFYWKKDIFYGVWRCMTSKNIQFYFLFVSGRSAFVTSRIRRQPPQIFKLFLFLIFFLKAIFGRWLCSRMWAEAKYVRRWNVFFYKNLNRMSGQERVLFVCQFVYDAKMKYSHFSQIGHRPHTFILYFSCFSLHFFFVHSLLVALIEFETVATMLYACVILSKQWAN